MSDIQTTPLAEQQERQLIPVLPLRDVVVYPHMVIPLFVGREKSILALEAAMADNKKILIEIKSDARIMVPLVAVIESSDLSPDQMVVICFNEDVLELAKKSMPHIKTLWLSSFEQGDDGKWTPTAEEIIATAMRINADGVHLKANPEVIDRVFVAKLRQADLEFHVWTVDDPEVARKMLRLGADSITTNRPGWLREQLQKDMGQ